MKTHPRLAAAVLLLLVAEGLQACSNDREGPPPAPRAAGRPTASSETASPAPPPARQASTATPPHAPPPAAAAPDDTPSPAPPPAGTAAGGPPPSSSSPPRGPRIRGLEVAFVEAAEGEDGRGNTVRAVRPVALDVRADAWPGRAFDPVLLVGDLVFRHYTHPAPGVLRYVAADAARLPEGATVAIRWGDDAATTRPVGQALRVPR